jgi:hypothetical protein
VIELLVACSLRAIADRFWRKVDTSGGPDACWPWLGYVMRDELRSPQGYGQFRPSGVLGRRLWKAHRFALFLATGEVPQGMDACHECDNTVCCNPSHLWWGTHQENMAHYVKKYGRIGVDKRPPAPRPLLFGLGDEPEPGWAETERAA